jgi:hypothetical protein
MELEGGTEANHGSAHPADQVHEIGAVFQLSCSGSACICQIAAWIAQHG